MGALTTGDAVIGRPVTGDGQTPSALVRQAASVLLKMLGEDTVQEDPAADALAKAKELLGGVDSAID